MGIVDKWANPAAWVSYFDINMSLQGDHHRACAKRWCPFFILFHKLSNKKKLRSCDQKMANIASNVILVQCCLCLTVIGKLSVCHATPETFRLIEWLSAIIDFAIRPPLSQFHPAPAGGDMPRFEFYKWPASKSESTLEIQSSS